MFLKREYNNTQRSEKNMNDLMKTPKITPRIQSTLKHTVEVPEVMYKASGINVNGRRIKSLLFSKIGRAHV